MYGVPKRKKERKSLSIHKHNKNNWLALALESWNMADWIDNKYSTKNYKSNLDTVFF